MNNLNELELLISILKRLEDVSTSLIKSSKQFDGVVDNLILLNTEHKIMRLTLSGITSDVEEYQKRREDQRRREEDQ